MRLEQLRYLIEIGKYHNISEASRHLYMTPQALNLSMKSLEKELNIKLLLRQKKGVVLSNNGEELAHLAEEFLKKIAVLCNQVDFTAKRDICLPMRNTFFEIFFDDLLIFCGSSYPNINLFPHILTHEQIADELNHGSVPYILVAPPNVEDFINREQFVFHELTQLSLYCVCSSGHPLASFKKISLRDIQDTTVIVRQNSYPFVKALFSEVTIDNFLLALSEKNLLTLSQLHHGVFLNILPTSFGQKYYANQFAYIPFAEDLALHIGYITKKIFSSMSKSAKNWPCCIIFLTR